MITVNGYKRLMECVEHAAARAEVQAATLRAESTHKTANEAHARECEAWARMFRAVVADAKREIES